MRFLPVEILDLSDRGRRCDFPRQACEADRLPLFGALIFDRPLEVEIKPARESGSIEDRRKSSKGWSRCTVLSRHDEFINRKLSRFCPNTELESLDQERS
jgi:hypothetical protein